MNITSDYVMDLWSVFCEGLEPNSTMSSAEICLNISLLGSHDPFKRAMNVLHVYLTPITILLGGFANLLSFLVFTVTHLKRQSSSIYLASLAMADIIFLSSLTFIWLGGLPSQMKLSLFHQDIWCQLVLYSTHVTTFLSVWYVVSFTVERYIIVHYPLRKDRYCTPKRAKRVVISLAGIGLLLYSFVPITSGVSELEPGRGVCMPLPEYYSLNTITTLLDTFLTFIIPSFIIVSLNIRIAIKIVRVSRQRTDTGFPPEVLRRCNNEPSIDGPISNTEERCHNMVCSWTREKNDTAQKISVLIRKSSLSRHSAMNKNYCSGPKFIRIASGRLRAQQRTARMLIIVSSVFVLVNLPQHGFRMYAFLSLSIDHEYQVPVNALGWQKLFNLIHQLHFAINFFLYSVYARQFRNALRKLTAILNHRMSTLCAKIAAFKVCHPSGSMEGV